MTAWVPAGEQLPRRDKQLDDDFMDELIEFIATEPGLPQFSGDVTAPVESFQTLKFGGDFLIIIRRPKSLVRSRKPTCRLFKELELPRDQETHISAGILASANTILNDDHLTPVRIPPHGHPGHRHLPVRRSWSG